MKGGYRRISVLLLLVSLSIQAQTRGIIATKSPLDVPETVARLATLLAERSLGVVARVDHGANAAGVEMRLAATEVLLFSNPQIDTTLLQCAQGVAIDLPHKALVWQDEARRVWVAFNDPFYLMERHALGDCREALEQLDNTLRGLLQSIAQPPP